ncbi:MAG: von Willebrand factor type A domain-containing protein, partial [Candidatus Eremiobacteraeota bacterium]|nr:von Willebrand factor type A domain-containing protein [Candidatus Eremiobacteraeota bacterium]
KQVEKSPSQDFLAAIQHPLSTFSADVDTASFANVRREIQRGVLPYPDLVRVEEMLNYFSYDLPEPDDGQPFSVTTELSDCPWSDSSKLMRVAIKTQSIDRGDEPARNLVFLLDVSGSMQNPDKLPLLKSSLRQLVDTLDDADRVAIVVYAGASGLVLPSTTGDQKTTILEAINRLEAGGSTNGAAGLQLAYQVAEQNKSQGSVNRIILATDGDFNVGLSSDSELKSYIE